LNTTRVASITACSLGSAASQSGTGYDPTVVVRIRGPFAGRVRAPVDDDAVIDGERNPVVAAITRVDFAREAGVSDKGWGQEEHMLFLGTSSYGFMLAINQRRSCF
jgi:hypothetical protein